MKVSVPDGLVTATATMPAAWAGVVAVIWVSESMVKDALVPAIGPRRAGRRASDSRRLARSRGRAVRSAMRAVMRSMSATSRSWAWMS